MKQKSGSGDYTGVYEFYKEIQLFITQQTTLAIAIVCGNFLIFSKIVAIWGYYFWKNVF